MKDKGLAVKFVILKLVGDIVFVNMSFVLAFLLRYQGELPPFNFQPYLNTMPFITIFAVLVFNFYGLYRVSGNRWSEIQAAVIISAIMVTVFAIVLSYMVQGFSFPRSVFIISTLLQFMVMSAWRWFIFYLENKKMPAMKIICIAPGEEAPVLVKKIIRGKHQVLGIITAKKSDVLSGEYPVLGSYPDAEKICAAHRPDAVIITGEAPGKVKRSVLKGSMVHGWEVYVVPGLYEIMLSRTVLEQVEDTPLLKVNKSGNQAKEQTKRFLDFACSIAALAVFAPLFLIIAAAIKINSPGPVFFVQERLCEGQRPFLIYKFRTMIDNAEAATGPVISPQNDARVTAVGKFLRATRLDELPQLINVLKGDMSIVGPRPERPYFVSQFEKDIPDYEYRHLAKAGITGMAQVMSRYSTSVEDKLKYDLLYASNSNLFTDIKIILQTMKVVLMKDRAS